MTACHVCGSKVGVKRPLPDVAPTCPRNDCQLAAAGMISVDTARDRIAKAHPRWTDADAERARSNREKPDRTDGDRAELAVLRRREINEAIRIRRAT